MGQYLKAFTLGRNFLKKTVRESADAAHRVIQDADAKALDLQTLKSNDNGRYNVVRDLISFAGIVNRSGNDCVVTYVGRRGLISQGDRVANGKRGDLGYDTGTVLGLLGAGKASVRWDRARTTDAEYLETLRLI